jgi:hypothetical protein
MRGKRIAGFPSWPLPICAFAFCPPLMPGACAQIAVDAYNPMEPPGEDGQKCTAEMLNAANHHSAEVPCAWGINGNAYVSTSRAMPPPAPVTVGGSTYADAGTRSIRLDNNDCRSGPDVNMVYADVKGKALSVPLSKITIACYLTQTETAPGWYRFDTICNRGGPWISLQSTNGGKAGKLFFGSHGQDDSGTSTYSPLIEVKPGKTYWVNLMFDGPAGKGRLAVFDPENAFAQVGDTVACGERTGGTISNRIGFGRVDGIQQGTFTGSTYFDHVMFDVNGAFPIFPKGGAPRAAPGAPAAGTQGGTTR